TNQFVYYIGNAYLPSFLLIVISYSTFYFNLNDFQDRVMVSITGLLVLTGLFTQTSSSVPKTAYLKLIDIWYMFCIIMDFVMVICIVIINAIHGSEFVHKVGRVMPSEKLSKFFMPK
ncbi:unnamed protein product, partial [Meganyctiphanes norvegica]